MRENAVLPVLFFASLTGALLFLPLILLSFFFPHHCPVLFKEVATADLRAHLFIFLKSILVGTSWILSYYAMKHLSISVVSPIRAPGPLWTLAGALVIFGERLGSLQWAGLITSLFFSGILTDTKIFFNGGSAFHGSEFFLSWQIFFILFPYLIRNL